MKPHSIQKSPKSAARRKSEKPSRLTVTRPRQVAVALDRKVKLKLKKRVALLEEGIGVSVGAVPEVKAPLQVKPAKLHPQLREHDVPNSPYKLLGPKKGVDPVALTLEAREQMAARCLELRDKLPKAVDKEALRQAEEEAAKREARRKLEAEERIKKLRERLGAADEDGSRPGTRKSIKSGGPTMATAAKKPAPKKSTPSSLSKLAQATGTKVPSAATAKRATGGYEESGKLAWLIKENPRSKGGATYARFAKYFGAKTVGEYLQKGGTLGDLRWDVAHKFLTVSK